MHGRQPRPQRHPVRCLEPRSDSADGRIARRTLLRASLDVAVVAAVGTSAPRAFAQRANAFAETELRPGLVQLAGSGGNVVLLRTGAGALLVDSGARAEGGELLRTVTAMLGGERVEALLNTHWHPDHTGGNDAFGEAGTTIIAHENTKLWMSTEHYVDWQDRTYAPRAAAALPTDTFYTSDPQPIRRQVGGVTVEYTYLREAHTDGDLYAFFPEHNVVVAGGAVSVGAYPVPDHATGGWIGGLEAATRALLDLADADTLIVPASGPAQRRAHLEAQLDMVSTVRERVADMMRQGKSAEEMLDAGVTAEFDAYWGGDPRQFVSNVYDGFWWQGRLDGSL